MIFERRKTGFSTVLPLWSPLLLHLIGVLWQHIITKLFLNSGAPCCTQFTWLGFFLKTMDVLLLIFCRWFWLYFFYLQPRILCRSSADEAWHWKNVQIWEAAPLSRTTIITVGHDRSSQTVSHVIHTKSSYLLRPIKVFKNQDRRTTADSFTYHLYLLVAWLAPNFPQICNAVDGKGVCVVTVDMHVVICDINFVR